MSGRTTRNTVALIAATWLAGCGAVDALSPDTLRLTSLYAGGPLIACAALSVMATAGYAVAAFVFGVGSGYWNHTAWQAQQYVRLIDVVLVSAAAVIVSVMRIRQSDNRARLAARAATAQERATAAVARAREAAEINDSIVQGMTVAKWSLEAGNLDRSLDVLTDTMTTAQDLVSQLLSIDHPVEPGELRRREPARLEH